jgi:hypothetical protein
MSILVEMTQGLPVWANLALLQFSWMLISAALLFGLPDLLPASADKTGGGEQEGYSAGASSQAPERCIPNSKIGSS